MNKREFPERFRVYNLKDSWVCAHLSSRHATLSKYLASLDLSLVIYKMKIIISSIIELPTRADIKIKIKQVSTIRVNIQENVFFSPLSLPPSFPPPPTTTTSSRSDLTDMQLEPPHLKEQNHTITNGT